MSKALKWLEAEADRLEKEYIENDDPNKTVNHSFIEGFNYALVNLQAIEELELNDNQKIVLEWLKSETILTREAPILSVNAFSDKNLLGKLPDKVRKAYKLLDCKQEYEVLAAFAQWGLGQEEAE
ncbi:hypothetical protein AL397_02905 [Enterococcus faecium]|uniref:hypothetical protein n=1 Tax=Enterococcus hirae TaxID=1354 RepID=UPI0005351C7F|nr:hypothetical protein AMR85_00380 [Enterococcus faecium]ALL10315.1 hypothetical protein AQ614_07295 [Enterococcus faecium]KNB94162.1 hypothetical protein LK34_04550 [Enterococcus faecium]KOR92826.1 hypothetical protein AL397_02905 [Enterococcus faecium]OFK92593.1 hypothetical protein HMPREF2793_11790 [Enterococcus sp. HMSC063H10]